MATANPIPPNVAQSIEKLMGIDGVTFNLWLTQSIVSIVNQTISDLADTDGDVSDLSTTVDGKADSGHNHNLNDLSEKSYNSLTDTPEAGTADDGPADVVAITSPTCASGTDQIDRTAFNSVLSTLESEINGLITALNTLKAAHNDIIDELQAAGLMF
jgi:hypothetical protein